MNKRRRPTAFWMECKIGEGDDSEETREPFNLSCQRFAPTSNAPRRRTDCRSSSTWPQKHNYPREERGWMNLLRGGNRSQRQTNERWSEGTAEAHHSLFACGFLRHHLPPFPRMEKERETKRKGAEEREERWKSERKMRGHGRGRRLTNEAGRRGERRSARGLAVALQ